MPGKVLLGVRVTSAALAQRFPEQSDTTRTAASAVLATIVPATLGWADAQRIGIGLQQRYGEQVQRLLDAMAADAVRTAPQHLSRLISLLETCAEQLTPPTGIGQWLRKDKVRPADLHSREIEQLKQRLSRIVAELEPTMAQVMKIRDDMATLAAELLATSLACEWLSDDTSLATEVRSALTERALAVTKTLALVRQQQEQSTATAMGLDALRDRIHDGVLNALPSWLAHLATLPPELNDTQRYVVRDELAQIIYRLKK